MRLMSTLLLSISLLLSSALQAASISGIAKLDPAVADGVGAEDTVFIFARASQGPPMPLALVRVQVKDLPKEFTLEDGQAMMPGMELSRFDTVDIVARVSKSGNAMPQPGDVEGSVKAVGNSSQDVEVVIDRVLP